MNNKTILITGICGFLGRHLEQNIKKKFPLSLIFGVDINNDSKNLNVFNIDLLNRNKLIKFLSIKKPDYIFHLAGILYSSDIEKLYTHNVLVTQNLLDCVNNMELSCKVIIPGSAAEYGNFNQNSLPIKEYYLPNPISPYGISKVWQSSLAIYYSNFKVDVVVGRVFNLMGEGMPSTLSLGSFASQLKKIRDGQLPPELVCGNLNTKRDFIDIEDACLGLIAIASNGKSGEIYNICSGKSSSIISLIKLMIKQTDVIVNIKSNEDNFKLNDILDIYGSNEKIFKDTGWKPLVNINEACKKMLN